MINATSSFFAIKSKHLELTSISMLCSVLPLLIILIEASSLEKSMMIQLNRFKSSMISGSTLSLYR